MSDMAGKAKICCSSCHKFLLGCLEVKLKDPGLDKVLDLLAPGSDGGARTAAVTLGAWPRNRKGWGSKKLSCRRKRLQLESCTNLLVLNIVTIRHDFRLLIVHARQETEG